MSNWTIFSNHGHVLVCLASDSEARLRDVAAAVGLTERAVQKIVRDLQQSGMVSVSKHGRRNRYRIDHTKTLRHNLEAHCKLGALVNLIINESTTETKPAVSKPAEMKPARVTPAPVKPVEAKPDKPATAEPGSLEKEPTKSKPAEPDATGSTERQQGSLF